MNRGLGHQRIFHGENYKKALIACLEEAHQQFGLELLAYCLMGNHYHLLVWTPQANLSRCMRHINGVYTQRYNKLRKSDGPLVSLPYNSPYQK
jgi:REP element-mobilizing transposase RayT